jgi:hypothetical protein
MRPRIMEEPQPKATLRYLRARRKDRDFRFWPVASFAAVQHRTRFWGEQPPRKAALADLVPIFPHGRATDAGLSKVMVNLTASPKG